jgi:hypothetical protein
MFQNNFSNSFFVYYWGSVWLGGELEGGWGLTDAKPGNCTSLIMKLDVKPFRESC